VRRIDRLAFAGFDKSERRALLALLGRVEANLGEDRTGDDGELREDAAAEDSADGAREPAVSA
jgi:hypothetical protein